MTFGFGRLKLSYKLSLLVAFILWNDTEAVKNHPIVLLLLSCLIAFDIILSVLFLRTLGASIGTIQTVSKLLATGKLDKGIRVNGLPETGEIGSAINSLREGVLHQTRFAEEIKGGNLEALYKPFH